MLRCADRAAALRPAAPCCAAAVATPHWSRSAPPHRLPPLLLPPRPTCVPSPRATSTACAPLHVITTCTAPCPCRCSAPHTCNRCFPVDPARSCCRGTVPKQPEDGTSAGGLQLPSCQQAATSKGNSVGCGGGISVKGPGRRGQGASGGRCCCRRGGRSGLRAGRWVLASPQKICIASCSGARHSGQAPSACTSGMQRAQTHMWPHGTQSTRLRSRGRHEGRGGAAVGTRQVGCHALPTPCPCLYGSNRHVLPGARPARSHAAVPTRLNRHEPKRLPTHPRAPDVGHAYYAFIVKG